ncbi:MAG: hypothetical protein V2A66_00515 [Pseudomonadota bacterium]
MKTSSDDIIALSADPKRGKADLSRFEKAYERASKHWFDWGAPGARTVLHIFGNSAALAARLIANPVSADAMSASIAKGRKNKQQLAGKLGETIAHEAPRDDAGFGSLLRRFKYREMTRLVAEDIEGTIETRAMLAEWSDVADVLIDAAFRRTFETLSQKMGTPMQGEAGRGEVCRGSIIALGKLGAGELNLSSDADLIFIYDTDEGGARNSKGRITTNHEFYAKLAAETAHLLSAGTSDGFVFRVDHELRPEGPQGPLANSLEAALRYYEYFGHDWERQALIRARAAAGDQSLGARFVEGIRPFVYRRSISIGDISHMRGMKEKVEHAAAASHGPFDVKHGCGGIREAEFLVQALQILHGGAHPSVRRQNTFEAIEALTRESLMHPYGENLLASSYSFLRRLENMLQAADDLQTHLLPIEESGFAGLARRMGYRDASFREAASRFRADLAKNTQAVAKLFRALFEADYERQELEEAIRDNLSRAGGEEEMADSLAWFKQREANRLASLDIEGKIGLRLLLARLTLVAEVVICSAWEISFKRLASQHGEPRSEDGSKASFAIAGMGRLGSAEIDYGSDLDLCFIYSCDGSTDGARPISNVEFFTKLAQRIISMISLSTRYGRAYLVDSELRPSGRSGTLVATLGSFSDYHTKSADIWEKLSLLKARAIAGDEPFLREVRSELARLAYGREPPARAEAAKEIARLRERSVKEKAADRQGRFDLKADRGGLADLESAIQYHQLMNAAGLASLRKQNTFDVVEALAAEGIIDSGLYDELSSHLAFFRRLISRLRLVRRNYADILDTGDPSSGDIAMQMGFSSSAALAEELDRRRTAVSRIYKATISQK